MRRLDNGCVTRNNGQSSCDHFIRGYWSPRALSAASLNAPFKENVRSLQSLGNFLYLYFLTCGIISYIVSGLWRLDTSPLLWSSICTSLFSCDYCHRDHLRLRLWEEAKKVDTVQLAFMALFPRSAFPVFALLPPLCPSVRLPVPSASAPRFSRTRRKRGMSGGRATERAELSAIG